MGYETNQPKSGPIVLILVLVAVGLVVVMAVGVVLLAAVFWVTAASSPSESAAPPMPRTMSAPAEPAAPQPVGDREMVVVLPEASQAVPLTAAPNEIIINIDAEGTITVAGEDTDDERLMELLLAAKNDNPAVQRVVIRADKECRWSRVADVLNMCNKVGIRDVSATVLPPPSDEPN